MTIDALIITSVAFAISMITTSCFWNIRRSRCTKVDLPCVHCVRENMNLAELEIDDNPIKIPNKISL